jgi:hypothetical protein
MQTAIKMFHTLKCLKQSFTYTDDDDNDDVVFSIKIIHMVEMQRTGGVVLELVHSF